MREYGILHVRVFSNTELGLDDAKEYLDAVMYLSEERPYSVVMDISGVTYAAKEAREWISEASSQRGVTVCAALIAKSYPSRIIANLIMTVSRPSYPVRTFTDEQEAMRWCRACYAAYMSDAEMMA